MYTVKVYSQAENKAYEGVSSSIIPVPEGVIEILPGHAESFGILGAGELLIKSRGEEKKLPVERGEFHFFEDVLTIFI